jgi:hypothetical protein
MSTLMRCRRRPETPDKLAHLWKPVEFVAEVHRANGTETYGRSVLSRVSQRFKMTRVSWTHGRIGSTFAFRREHHSDAVRQQLDRVRPHLNGACHSGDHSYSSLHRSLALVRLCSQCHQIRECFDPLRISLPSKFPSPRYPLMVEATVDFTPNGRQL